MGSRHGRRSLWKNKNPFLHIGVLLRISGGSYTSRVGKHLLPDSRGEKMSETSVSCSPRLRQIPAGKGTVFIQSFLHTWEHFKEVRSDNSCPKMFLLLPWAAKHRAALGTTPQRQSPLCFTFLLTSPTILGAGSALS